MFIALCINSKAYKKIDYEALWTETLVYYTTYTLEKLLPIIQHLAEYVVNAPKAKLKNVYNKYKSKKHQEIALTAEKSADVVQNIINLFF